MDTCNKGFNYSVLGELRACQEGLHKGQRGLLPSSFPVRQIAARVEREAAKYMELVPDDTGAIWVFEPKRGQSVGSLRTLVNTSSGPLQIRGYWLPLLGMACA